MALKFPKFLTGTDAKSRIIILFAGVAGFFLVVYLLVHYFSGDTAASGPSKVANAPKELKSVPGSQLSPEYYRALTQANAQASQQAQMTGGSAVPTLINVPTQLSTGSSGDCTVMCPSEDKVTVTDDLNELVKSGKLTQSVANSLLELANKNVSVDEYAAALDELVRQGKLTPEQARALLEKYKKQHANALLTESAKSMDTLIKSGQLSLTAANELLELQKKGLPPAEYAAELQQLAREGKISQQVSNTLAGQYTQQAGRELAKQNAFLIKQMSKAGEITTDVAKNLIDLQNKDIPLNEYSSALDQLVKAGKMTPESAAKLLALYKKSKEAGGVAVCLEPLLNKGGESAAQLERLINLQSNNATLGQYTEELKRGVQSGIISPDMAACALQNYQAMTSVPRYEGATAPAVQQNIPGAKEFAEMQQRVNAKQAAVAPTQQTGQTPAEVQQFNAAQAQALADAERARAERIQAIQTAMSAQAQSLLTAWQAPMMSHVAGAPQVDESKGKSSAAGANGSTSSGSTNGEGEAAVIKPSIIKAGTIFFAVLDTAVDSDYPDTPVMATIVDGPYKGAKVLGKLALAQGKDRVTLNFTSMDKDDWDTTKNISAFAIDPDTAHTVLASSVDYHYLKRYGAMMAAAFVSGYSSAITQAGTSTTGIFGTSSEHPELSPTDKIAVGLGQVGTTMGQNIASYINTPATVKVNSGVGIGILFTAAVTE